MKKFLVFTFLFFSLAGTVYAESFPDVSTDNENYAAITYLKEKGIIHGYEDGTFGPDNTLNRAEALKIIVAAFQVKFDGEYDVLFPDVKDTDWFFPYVMGAKEAEIVHGYPDGTFKPGDSVNLAEALKIIVLAANVTLAETVNEDVFVDVPKTEWYAPHAFYAREHNVILADEEGKIYAAVPMKRGPFVEVIYRMMVVMENNEKEFPLYTNWPEYVSTKLPFKMKYDDEEWEIIENQNEVIFFRKDKQHSDFAPNRIYPNAGAVTVTIDQNEDELTETEYFDNIKNVFEGATYNSFKLAEFNALEVIYSEKRTVDWYIYLDNSDVLVVYTEYGDGSYGVTLKKIIKAMLSTFTYNDDVNYMNSYEEILNEIFGNILVEGKGMEMLDLLPNKLIIETDTIGVGTGPVDYYYSENVDYTFKYERASDVILDKREGRTSAF